jgi:hypothetical protein
MKTSQQQGSQLKHLWRGGNLGGLPMVNLLYWWAPLEAVDKLGCEMQFERFYSLNHSIVPWFAQFQQLGTQPRILPDLGKFLWW